MLFNSLEFLIFFPIVTAVLDCLTGVRSKTWWLLAASCVFYAAFIPSYLLILFLVIGIDYTAGLAMGRAQGLARKRILALSLGANLGILFFFKYFNFGMENLAGLLRVVGWEWKPYHLSWVLPIGLSFHTFQAMAYTIEVYRGRVKPERNLPTYALYVLFYPQLVAGPIERPDGLLPQLRRLGGLQPDAVIAGLRIMLVGFFKKIVIADRLSVFVDAVFAHPDSYSALEVVTGCVFFSFQIYCDFSGYTDIAIGCARVMGIELMPNFNRPYLAHSVTEFWRRWHLSLSTWFRDYVYIPLGGSRGSMRQTLTATMIVFLASGLWHGAAWTFVVWGLLHGTALSWERWTGAGRFWNAHRRAGRAATLVWVTVAWVFFRAKDFDSVGRVFQQVGHLIHADAWTFSHFLSAGGPEGSPLDFVFGGVLCGALFAVESSQEGRKPGAPRVWPRWMLDYALLFSVLWLGRFSREQFIYFQF